MKSIIAFFLVCFSVHCSLGQSLQKDSVTNKYVIQGIVICDSSLTQQALYDKSKEWVVRHLKSDDNNISLNDNSYKQLTSTGVIKGSDISYAGFCTMTNCGIEFKLTLDFKKGKIRYTIENIVHKSNMQCNNNYQKTSDPIESLPHKSKWNEKIMEDVNIKLNSLVKDFTSSMSSNTKKDDW